MVIAYTEHARVFAVSVFVCEQERVSFGCLEANLPWYFALVPCPGDLLRDGVKVSGAVD